jgi:hypothetical protein
MNVDLVETWFQYLLLTFIPIVGIIIGAAVYHTASQLCRRTWLGRNGLVGEAIALIVAIIPITQVWAFCSLLCRKTWVGSKAYGCFPEDRGTDQKDDCWTCKFIWDKEY